MKLIKSWKEGKTQNEEQTANVGFYEWYDKKID